MNNEVTIIYCSSNREMPEFEQRIRDNILEKCGGLPIVSVTQKPIDFGTNICVGDDIGVSGFNFFRQSLIACKAAKTRFVLSCEADCLYPEDYFQFVPERDDKCYRSDNVYVMGQHRKYFFRKPRGATHAQIVNREFYIKNLERCFEGEPMWDATQFNFPKEKFHKKYEDVFAKGDIEYYMPKNPVVQIKTSQSMRNYTSAIREPIYEIPYWGCGGDFRDKYYKIIRDGIKLIH
jgi:hypothetical protein